MNIAGVLVHAHPDKIEAVEAALDDMTGVEVHQATADGRLIVTVEERPGISAGGSLLAINRIEGVLSAALVYHHFEPEPEARPSGDKSHAAITA